ncbi:MAG: amino acid transporter [Acidobacteria bacterium]|nr:MAG: amino acid transporter [Acidobacteriota bacterium]
MASSAAPGLARRIGAFDATMIVMGGIVGSGIFANPREVAIELPSAPLLLAAWIAGGVMALLGALIYAELAARRPGVGGQYAYLRDAYHPLAAFLYGWVLLLVVQTGGMAAVALIFARYSGRLLGVALPEPALGMAALLALTVVNCLGVAMGARVQSALMVLKIAAIATLIVCGWLLVPPVTGAAAAAPLAGQGVRALFAFGAAMAPVLFAYGGWQTASFVSGELRDPRRDLPRGLLLGVSGVIVLYLGVNWVCVRALGGPGLAQTLAPASAVMERALGPAGARLIAAGIAISTLGFLSQSMLTAPRVYYAMANDGVFFERVGRIHPRTRVPVVAIALQGAFAMLLTAWGQYRQILDYMIAVDFIFFGLTASCLFVFRRRDGGVTSEGFRTPGHPWTTAIFVAGCWLFVANLVAQKPRDTLLGMAILLTGVPAFALWSARRSRGSG